MMMPSGFLARIGSLNGTQIVSEGQRLRLLASEASVPPPNGDSDRQLGRLLVKVVLRNTRSLS